MSNSIKPEQKLALINKWFDFFYKETESFYPDRAGALGAELAYLFAAIASPKRGFVHIFDGPGEPRDSMLLKLLERARRAGRLSAEDRKEIFAYIEIERPENSGPKTPGIGIA